jgi:amino acid transporter
LVIAKTAPLVLFVVAGVGFVDWSRVTAWEVPRPGVLGEAALLLLFAYAGFENTPAAAGEYRNPRRDVPVALLIGMLFITVIYSMVQIVSVGTLPGLEQAGAPLAEAARLFMGGGGAMLMTIGAIISIAGNISNTILVGPRYLFALANDGFGPRVLSRVHSRYHTPAAAIVTQSAVSLVLALSGSFVQLAMLSIIARLATYIGTAAAVPVLRRRFGDRRDAVRLPGGAAIPVAAVGLSLVFLASTTWQNLAAGGIALLAGGVIYRFRREPEPIRP